MYTINNEIQDAINYLLDFGIVSENAIDLVTAINGYNIDTINDIIYAVTGYHDLEQLKMYE